MNPSEMFKFFAPTHKITFFFPREGLTIFMAVFIFTTTAQNFNDALNPVIFKQDFKKALYGFMFLLATAIAFTLGNFLSQLVSQLCCDKSSYVENRIGR